ncbi:hypothetical protein RFI_15487, partial [Reticulomyxa filosa]
MLCEDIEGMTPFELSIEYQHVDVVEWYLKEYDSDKVEELVNRQRSAPNVRIEWSSVRYVGQTPLHITLRESVPAKQCQKLFRILKSLVEHHADVLKTDETNHNAIHLAIEFCYPLMLLLLLKSLSVLSLLLLLLFQKKTRKKELETKWNGKTLLEFARDNFEKLRRGYLGT